MERTNRIMVFRGIRARSVSALMFIVSLGWSISGYGQTCPQDLTAAHFNQGTPGPNTVVVPDYDGAVILTPLINEEFAGPFLPSGWVDGGPWTPPNGGMTYPGGSVVVNGSHFYSAATYTPGTSIEFVATFTAGNFQNVGFSTGGGFGSPWVTIGRGDSGGTGLYARTSTGASSLLGNSLLNNPHLFKIIWNATDFQFFVDGVLIQTVPFTVSTAMVIQISDYVYDTGGIVLTVDNMRICPFATSGTYISRVFDGVTPKNWGAVTWNADLPAGTGLSVYVRSGDVAIPDGTWSELAQVPSSGSIAGGTSRYIQYQAVLSTSNTLYAPELKDISIACTEASLVAPTVTLQPVSKSSCTGQTVVFESSAYGYPSPDVQWQESSDNGSTWTDITGAINPVLSVLAGENGKLFRAEWSNIAGPPVFSDAALLTIGITASIDAVDPLICSNGNAELRLASATGKAPWGVTVNGTLYNVTETGTVFATIQNLISTQVYNLTSVIDADGCLTTGDPLSSVTVTVSPVPYGTLSALSSSVEEGDPVNLVFNATAGTGQFSLTVNGTTFNNVTSGTPFTFGPAEYSSSIWEYLQGGEPGVVDNVATELGVKFRASVPGLVRGIRFYKRIQQTGIHTGSLWTNTGTLLATGTFNSETSTGWQEMYFDQPVLIQPNTTYVASYYAPNGNYAFDGGYFNPGNYANGSLTALQNGVDGGNGVFLRGAGFPTDTYNGANYWVDIIFENGAGSNTSTFYLTSLTSADGCILESNPVSYTSVTVSRNVWTGAVDADWGNYSNWALSSVPGTVDVTIPAALTNYPVISGNVITDDLTLWPTASLSLNAGGALTVNGELRTTGATMTINSTAVNSSGSLIVNGTSEGNVTYNRVMPADLYRYVSSPVVSTTLPAGTTFWKWNEEIGYWGDTPSEEPVTTGVAGRGYTMLATGSGVTFTGEVLTGQVSVTATAPFGSDYVKNRDEWGGGGWNLLGNPYPSALRVVDSDGTSENDFIHHNLSSFDPGYQAVYIYDGSDYDYIALGIPGYTTGMGVFGSNDIQAGQGFFVLTHYNGLPFTFRPEMRTHNTTAVMTKSGSVPWPGVQLKVKAGTEEKATLIAYGDGMSAGLDPGYDVGHLSSGAGIELYSVLAGGGSDYNFARQALPVSEAGSLVVPVGVDFAGGGEVTFSAFTIPLEGKKFWLEDRTAKTYTELGTNSYTVTLPSNTYGTGRFFIIASTNTPTGIGQPEADDGGLRIWHSGGRVIIQGDVSEGSLCEIYKMNGAKVLAGKLTGGEMNTVDLAPGTNGVIIVRITDGIKVTTRKLAIPDRR